jgi:hypothetical protein
MTEPVYFVVERWHGRMCSRLVFDQLPRLPKTDTRRVYAMRVDDQPHLAGRTRQELHDIWELLGKLPAASELPPPNPVWPSR